MMRRKLIRVVSLALGVATMIGLAAFAHRAIAREGGHWRHGMFKDHVNAKIEGALEAAKATDAQRTAILAARDHAFAAVEATHGRGKADFERALALFEQERIDPAEIAKIRAEHEAEAKTVGDAVVQAVTDAHDALTAPQRKAVADYLRAEKPKHLGDHRGFFKRMVMGRVDDALDAAKASPVQRKTIEAAAERAFAAVAENRRDPGARIDQVLALFEADTIDQAKVAELRAEHLAEMRKTGDVVIGAIEEAHQALSPAQRKAVVEWVRAQHAEHME